MSRLIIKGLPTRYDDNQLRQLFSFAGEVTDAKVIKTREGKSRQFGFVGFRTPQEASAARHRLDKCYVDTSKVSVQLAHAIGEESIPRPWSKYSKGSSHYENKNREREDQERRAFLKREHERNRQRRAQKERETADGPSERERSLMGDFEESLAKRGSKPVWADGRVEGKEQKTLVKSRKKGGENTLLERKHVTFNLDDSDDEDDHLYEEIPENSVGEQKISPGGNPPVKLAKLEAGEDAGGGSRDEGDIVALDEHISDMDYFKSKVVRGSEDDVDLEDTDTGQKNVDASSNQGSSSPESSDGDSDDEQRANSSHATTEQKIVGGAAETATQGVSPATDINSEKAPEMTRPSSLEQSDEAPNHDPFRQKKAELEKVNPGDTGRLMIRNLAYSVTEEELETIFEPFGVLSEVHIVKDNRTRKSRGMAFVQYMIPEHAPKAMISMDGKIQSGRIMHVLPAKPRPSLAGALHGDLRGRRNLGDTDFKIEREDARKDAARKGLDNISQHALHMSSDAVAQVIADRHHVSKEELYGTGRGESGIAAVRVAMGEAMLQSETRQFLLDHGIDLDAATRANLRDSAKTAAAKKKRMSRTAFLAKNLPAHTTEKELHEVFSKFGGLRRLLVAPSGLLAVIEFDSCSDAKRAYNSLAYTKFGDAPLYLEWLPREALRDVKEAAKIDKPAGEDEVHSGDVHESHSDHEAEAEEGLQSATVFVKNLNFDTRDAGLQAHFKKVLRKHSRLVDGMRSATVAMKRGGKGREGERLSMGFGFLEFSSHAAAAEVVKVGQNSVLDGHTLQLRLSKQVGEKEGLKKRKRSVAKTKAGPKLMVRNVAFQATKQDIKQLFSSFGMLKNVRIPRRMDGTHRGFAFVEFASKNEAKSALEALSASHLYGRHLVIEYAENNDESFMSVGELQAKAAAEMGKKRIKMVDGSAGTNGDGEDRIADEQAMIEDEMYA
eukprot:GFKZ01014694.1.p1 GENE.GFKZ01014694.1~~GFKZ01014694.1.p1  ORF type:complete len:951 (+),score=200.65 GFKZ01014694.1:63-2915(+)